MARGSGGGSGGGGSAANTISALTAVDLKSLTVTGAQGLAVTLNSTTSGTALATINAGAHTGSTFTLDATNSAVAITATGSAGIAATAGALGAQMSVIVERSGWTSNAAIQTFIRAVNGANIGAYGTVTVTNALVHDKGLKLQRD